MKTHPWFLFNGTPSLATLLS